MSLYNWFNYSLFEPIQSDLTMPHYWNCILFIYYLLWDTYKMLFSEHCAILYRTDLMIHHAISLFTYFSLTNFTSLQMSNVLIMESISLFNHMWRENPMLLNWYRLLCILFLRVPLCCYMLFYYNMQCIMHYAPTMEVYRIHQPYENIYYLFLLYDAFLLKQVYSNLRKLKSSWFLSTYLSRPWLLDNLDFHK